MNRPKTSTGKQKIGYLACCLQPPASSLCFGLAVLVLNKVVETNTWLEVLSCILCDVTKGGTRK